MRKLQQWCLSQEAGTSGLGTRWVLTLGSLLLPDRLRSILSESSSLHQSAESSGYKSQAAGVISGPGDPVSFQTEINALDNAQGEISQERKDAHQRLHGRSSFSQELGEAEETRKAGLRGNVGAGSGLSAVSPAAGEAHTTLPCPPRQPPSRFHTASRACCGFNRSHNIQ